MIRDDVNRSSGSFQVVTPVSERCIDGCEFLVMDIVVLLCFIEGFGEVCDWVEVAIRSSYRHHGSQGVVRGISLYHDRHVRDPVCEDWSHCEGLFEGVKGGLALVGPIPRNILLRQAHKWHCDHGVAINKTAIKVREAEERLDIPDFAGFWPVLDGLNLILGHTKTTRRKHVSKVFAGCYVEFTFVHLGI